MATDATRDQGIKKSKVSGMQVFRDVFRWAIVAYILLLSIGHTLTWPWAAGLHTICPFGGVVNLYTCNAFGIAASEPDSSIIRDLGAKYGFEVTAVREYVAAHHK